MTLNFSERLRSALATPVRQGLIQAYLTKPRVKLSTSGRGSPVTGAMSKPQKMLAMLMKSDRSAR